MGIKMVATNKGARRNYEILETFEAGIVLRGSEVKSLRESKVTISDAYARFENRELWVVSLHIAAYTRASTHVRTDTSRRRKLLLHRRELDRLYPKVEQDHLNLVPMALYFNKDNRAKLEIGLGRGKKLVDKRQTIAKRDSDREARRELEYRSR